VPVLRVALLAARVGVEFWGRWVAQTASEAGVQGVDLGGEGVSQKSTPRVVLQSHSEEQQLHEQAQQRRQSAPLRASLVLSSEWTPHASDEESGA
jgi:hypothetical protein